MLNISDWPNDASVCSLSQILETGPIPQRFYLSARACAGILRRAEKRGKVLPDMLRQALESVASQQDQSDLGGRVSGPVEAAACLTANGGGQAMDFEVETFLVESMAFPAEMSGTQFAAARDISPALSVSHTMGVAHALRGEGFDASEDGTGRGTPLVPVAYSIMPQNSGKDYKARQVDVAQPLMAGGPVGGNQGGDYIVAPIASTSKDHGVAYAIQERAVSENPDAGPDGMGVREGVAYTLEAWENVQAVAFDTTQITSPQNYSKPKPGDPSHPLAAGAHPPAIAIAEPYTLMERGRDGESNLEYRQDGTANAILTPNGGRGGLGVGAIATRWAVRRLTPLECSRLQGFPDDHARIPWRGKPAELCPDGPQYKTYGNSMAVNVMAWIGQRLDAELRKVKP